MLSIIIDTCEGYLPPDENDNAVDLEVFSPRNIEVNYDFECTVLFSVIQRKDWKRAAQIATEYPEQVRIWVHRYDGGKSSHCSILRWRMLPIHALFVFSGSRQLLALFLFIYPESATLTDDQEMLPLHLACRNGSDKETLEELLIAFPRAIMAKDYKGRTPLDLVRTSTHPHKHELIAIMLTCSEKINNCNAQQEQHRSSSPPPPSHTISSTEISNSTDFQRKDTELKTNIGVLEGPKLSIIAHTSDDDMHSNKTNVAETPVPSIIKSVRFDPIIFIHGVFPDDLKKGPKSPRVLRIAFEKKKKSQMAAQKEQKKQVSLANSIDLAQPLREPLTTNNRMETVDDDIHTKDLSKKPSQLYSKGDDTPTFKDSAFIDRALGAIKCSFDFIGSVDETQLDERLSPNSNRVDYTVDSRRRRLQRIGENTGSEAIILIQAMRNTRLQSIAQVCTESMYDTNAEFAECNDTSLKKEGNLYQFEHQHDFVAVINEVNEECIVASVINQDRDIQKSGQVRKSCMEADFAADKKTPPTANLAGDVEVEIGPIKVVHMTKTEKAHLVTSSHATLDVNAEDTGEILLASKSASICERVQCEIEDNKLISKQHPEVSFEEKSDLNQGEKFQLETQEESIHNTEINSQFKRSVVREKLEHHGDVKHKTQEQDITTAGTPIKSSIGNEEESTIDKVDAMEPKSSEESGCVESAIGTENIVEMNDSTAVTSLKEEHNIKREESVKCNLQDEIIYFNDIVAEMKQSVKTESYNCNQKLVETTQEIIVLDESLDIAEHGEDQRLEMPAAGVANNASVAVGSRNVDGSEISITCGPSQDTFEGALFKHGMDIIYISELIPAEVFKSQVLLHHTKEEKEIRNREGNLSTQEDSNEEAVIESNETPNRAFKDASFDSISKQLKGVLTLADILRKNCDSLKMIREHESEDLHVIDLSFTIIDLIDDDDDHETMQPALESEQRDDIIEGSHIRRMKINYESEQKKKEQPIVKKTVDVAINKKQETRNWENNNGVPSYMRLRTPTNAAIGNNRFNFLPTGTSRMEGKELKRNGGDELKNIVKKTVDVAINKKQETRNWENNNGVTSYMRLRTPTNAAIGNNRFNFLPTGTSRMEGKELKRNGGDELKKPSMRLRTSWLASAD